MWLTHPSLSFLWPALPQGAQKHGAGHVFYLPFYLEPTAERGTGKNQKIWICIKVQGERKNSSEKKAGKGAFLF